MKPAVALLALLLSAATAIPLVRKDMWWIRAFDFPRGQILVVGLATLAAYLSLWDALCPHDLLPLAALSASVVYQALRMRPYTPLAARQVRDADARAVDPAATLSLLVANVLMTNREAAAFLALARRYSPDLILTLETDDWWAAQLTALAAEYPHTVARPLPNTYGIMLHSRLPLAGAELRSLLKDDIPSLRVDVTLRSGQVVRLFGLHPEPPYPDEARSTTKRDAELLLVGKEAAPLEGPVIVAGDMNDVAWSYTTALFRKTSRLLDPRIGRGMFNTFHARVPLIRWPLDHVFHSNHFTLLQLERGPAWGSDHFPVFIRLALTPEAAPAQPEPEPDADEQALADAKIADALDE